MASQVHSCESEAMTPVESLLIGVCLALFFLILAKHFEVRHYKQQLRNASLSELLLTERLMKAELMILDMRIRAGDL
jgi:hypothetical protein